MTGVKPSSLPRRAGEAGVRDIITGTFHGDGNKNNNPERTLRFYDGVGCASDYKYEDSTLYAKLYASSDDGGAVSIADGAAAASAEGWIPHGGTLALSATPPEGMEFSKWTGDTWAIADGCAATDASIEVSTPYAVQLRATFKPAVNARLTVAADGADSVDWSSADWRNANDDGEAISAPSDKVVTIVAHKSVTLTLDASVSLSKFIVQADANCVVTFASGAGGSFYAGEVVVSNGVLRQGSAGVLGATPKVTVENGGTFDVNNLAPDRGTTFSIAGAGAGNWPWALTSSANVTSDNNSIDIVSLAGDATIGGDVQMCIGVRGGATFNATTQTLPLTLNGHTLTKTGTGTLWFRRPYSTNEGTIDVQSGTLRINGWSNANAAYAQSCVSNIVLILRDGAAAKSELSDPLYFKSLDVRGGTLSSSTGAFGVNEEIILDPIRNPISLQAAPAFASGAKVVLTNSYADVTCGKLVLMTWSGSGTVTPPAFDASCVSGTPDGLTVETAPDGTAHQLVLRVGGYEENAKAIRIAPIGDSITQGVTKDDQGDYPQYRTTMAAHLAAHGYRPTLCGIWKYADQDKAGVHAPDEWAWHTGVSGDAIITTDKSGGVLDNLHLYLDVIGKPDVITLLIGTNDMGRNGKSAGETYVNWTNLVWEIVRQRPGVKIVASTILDRKDNADGVKAKVAAFNALLKAGMNAGNLPANLSLVDLFDAVPLATAGNFFSDELHPNWQGHAIMAKGFADGIMSACPYASFTPTVDDTATNEAQSPLGASGIDELAEYRSGFRHVYTIDAAETNSFPNSGIAPYTATNAVLLSSKKLAKVGYYMELVRKGTNRRRWVWVDMDASGKTLGDVALPWDANPDRPRQFIVEKLHIKSNDSAVHAVAPTDDSVSGVFEGSPYNYSAGGTTAQLSGVPANLMTGGFGWNDDMTGTSSGYGCFQMHRIFTAEQKAAAGVPHDAEVLFAWNRWGSNSDNPNHADDIGIGTYACHATGVITKSREGNLDYTQTANGQGNLADTVSAKAYQVRRVEIWIMPDTIWTNADGTGSFSAAANWSSGEMPGEGRSFKMSLSGDTTVTLGSAYAFGNVLIEGTGSIGFDGEGSLTLGRVLLTNGVSFAACGRVTAAGIDLPTGSAATLTTLDGIAEGGVTGTGALALAPGDAESVTIGGLSAFTGDFSVTPDHSMTGTLTCAATTLGKFTLNGTTNVVFTLVNGTGGSFMANEVVVAGGVLQQGTASVLSTTPKLTVLDGGTFDVNIVKIETATKLYIAGAGAGNWPWAVCSSGGSMTNGNYFADITLSADSTIGGPGQIKIGASSTAANKIVLNNHKLTLAGTKSATFRNINTDAGTLELAPGYIITLNTYDNLNSDKNNYTNTTLIIRENARVVNQADRNIYATNVQLDGGNIWAGSGPSAENQYGFGPLSTLSGHGMIAKLDMPGGTVYKPDGLGYLNVTNSLTVKVTVDLSGFDFTSRTEPVPLLKVPTSLAETAKTAITLPTIPKWKLSKKEDGDGNTCFYIGKKGAMFLVY